MSNGRTMWFAQDVARHRRSLMVDLQDEFGPAALALDVVLTAHAKEQNEGGEVRDGFSALAREAGMSGQGDVVRAFVERAAEIGWLDDLVIDEDGRRFSARVSGWKSDQDRARSAWKKAGQRDAKKDPSLPDSGDGDKGGQGGDMSPVVPKCPPTAQHSTVKTTTTAQVRVLPDFLSELIAKLRDVPSWDRELSQGADAGVLVLVQSNPGVPWLDLAAEAVASRLDSSAGSLRTDSPVQALTFRLNDHRRPGPRRGPPKRGVSDETARRHAEEEAILRGEVA